MGQEHDPKLQLAAEGPGGQRQGQSLLPGHWPEMDLAGSRSVDSPQYQRIE